MDKSANQQIGKSKITLQMLSDVMAENSGRSKTATELFVRNFFTTIKDALIKDNIVKIKGLGTFKMVVVNARESVNVNTGERVSIAEYNKITFTPDKALKDRVNQPFAQFETIELEDEDLAIVESSASRATAASSASDADQPAATIKIAQPEESSEPTIDTPAEGPTKKVVTDTKPTQTEPSSNKPERQDEAVVAEPEVELQSQTEDSEGTLTRTKTDTKTEAETKVEPAAPATQKNIWKTLFLILLGLVLMGGAYFLGRNDLLKFDFTAQSTNQTQTAQSKEKDVKVIKTDSDSVSTDNGPAVSAQESDSIRQLRQDAESYPQVEGGRYLICGIKAYRKIKPGFTIQRYCMRLYGDTEPMEYILKLNDLQTTDVPVGRIIKFPILLEK